MIWNFLQDQVLGMKWLNSAIGSLLDALGLDITSRLGGSLQFFLYDVIKITILLCTLIFLISYIQSYFPPERSKKIIGRFHGLGANCIAALLGTVTPFCSCSSIPLFMGFTGAGLPVGVTFSFLISSPMVDLGSLILLASIFGAKVAVTYVVVGLVIAVAGGSLAAQALKLHEIGAGRGGLPGGKRGGGLAADQFFERVQLPVAVVDPALNDALVPVRPRLLHIDVVTASGVELVDRADVVALVAELDSFFERGVAEPPGVPRGKFGGGQRSGRQQDGENKIEEMLHEFTYSRNLWWSRGVMVNTSSSSPRSL